jgi:1,4-dihydroxy-2-naphthoyl-CoA synthase
LITKNWKKNAFIEAVAGTADEKSYTHILTETRGKVGLITLNRPKALNALCSDLFTEVNDALKNYDNSGNIGAVVITGSKKAFAGKKEFMLFFLYSPPIN